VIPSSSNLKWRVGSSNGELMIGFSNDDLTHSLSCRAERADAEAIRPDLCTGKLLCARDSSDFQKMIQKFWTNLPG
jgi:hypothetical protein